MLLLRNEEQHQNNALASSSGHRPIRWGGCDINLQWTQCFAGPYL